MPAVTAASKIAKIIAKKRAEDIAKKKVAKIPPREAKKVAVEQMRGGRNTNRKISKRTGLSPEERKEVSVKHSIKKIEFTRPRNPKDVRYGRVVAKEQARKSLANPPKPKPSKKSTKQVFLTRGPKIAKRSEVEEVTKRRVQKQERKDRLQIAFKKLSPEQQRSLMARAEVKRAMKRESTGQTKYGIDIKPREQLDNKVIQRTRELTNQEKNEIARKEAIEFGQRREAERRVDEGLKARNRNISEKLKNMNPDQKRRYLNSLRERGW